VPQNYEKAMTWYLKAVEQGDAASQHNLALMYANGEGVGTGESVNWTD
jgi:TPR repeat protein